MFKHKSLHRIERPNITTTTTTTSSLQNIPRYEGPCRFVTLPMELQIRIFILAQNPAALATTCKVMYELGQSDIVRARYLIQRYGTHAALGERSMTRRIVTLGVVQQLLRLNCCDPKADGDYWLFTAACGDGNQLDLCKMILESIRSWEKRENSKTASQLLTIATLKGAIPVIDLIVDTFGVDIKREKVLAIACMENQVETVKHLAQKYGCNVRQRNDVYLRDACLYGHTELVKYLLSEGADVHAYSDAALQNAVYHRFPALVNLLLDAGADAATQDNICLRHATMNEDVGIMEMLISAGADPRFDGDWPLRHACQLGLDAVVAYLLDTLQVENLVNARNGSLLRDCLIHGRVSTLELLLKKYGADPNSLGALLGIAVALKSRAKNSDTMARLLLDAGMDLNQHSEEVRQLLEMACYSTTTVDNSYTKVPWM